MRKPVLYDKEITDIYDDLVNSGYYNYRKVVKVLADILDNRKKILELGIGTGNVAIPLSGKGFEVDGIDPSPFMLKVLENKLKNNSVKINFHRYGVENINLNSKYDAAFSFGSPFWVVVINGQYYFDTYLDDQKEYERALENVLGILKKGGLLLLNIQHHGESFELPLKNGIEYHFTIEDIDNNHIIKTHYFEKNGKPVFNKPYLMFRLSQAEALKMFKDKGFKNIGRDKTSTFWVFRKQLG